MNLTELKETPVKQLVDIAKKAGIENPENMTKQQMTVNILKAHVKSGEDIFGSGVLEILPDGFGFLRSASSSYLASPDDPESGR